MPSLAIGTATYALAVRAPPCARHGRRSADRQSDADRTPVISAEVMRALVVAGYPVAEPCATCGRRGAPDLEGLINWLVQRRIRELEVAIKQDASWSAVARWPGADRALEAVGRTPADAVAKIVLEVAAAEPPPRPSASE